MDSLRLAGTCRTIMLIGLCTGVLLGCGQKKTEQSTSPSGQIVAHVGNEDVTTQELDNEFHLANVPPDKQKDPAIVKQVLGELVLRKYLLQQALEAKLDREPKVLLDLLRARAQVLSNAYLSRTVAAKPVSQADIDTYIADNPLKFANRQLVSVEQIVFPIGPTAQSVVDASKDLKSLDEVDQKLNSMSVPHSPSMGALNTADIPPQLFDLIQAKKADNVFFTRLGPNGIFFKVTGEEPRPLTGEAAANLARQYIRSDQLKAEIGIASTAANLEAKYQGDYATIMSNPSGATPSGKN